VTTTTAPAVAAPIAAATASSRQRAAGIAALVGGSASNQVGAAAGAHAFPVIGAVGVVAIRQLTTAAVLVPLVRPRLRALTRAQWGPVLGLVAVFSVMNLSLYLAVDRIGLALAVTLEFLGPLTVALLGSRRRIDLACALLAAPGVVVMTRPGPTTDLLGVALGLTAAAAWACYILLNRSVGQRLPGLEGTAAASLVTALVWLPVAAVWFVLHPPTPAAILLAVSCGVLSSVVPYVADLVALRRVPAELFGTLSSVSPVWAALAGWLLLGQALEVHEWLGMALILAGNSVVSVAGRPGVRRGGGTIGA